MSANTLQRHAFLSLSSQDWARICLIAGGHLLIEDIPGTGKTHLAKGLAQEFSLTTKRIQCTNDIMPADITGFYLFNPTKQSMDFRAGPIFTEVLLVDELNRAPSRSQSALLEAMEEKQVSVDGQLHPLPSNFMVIATQNPEEHVGVFPLPESTIDRFWLTIQMDRPNPQEYLGLLQGSIKTGRAEPSSKPQNLVALREDLKHCYADESVLKELIGQIAIVEKLLQIEITIRSRIQILTLSRSLAVFQGRDYLIPDDYMNILHKKYSALGAKLTP